MKHVVGFANKRQQCQRLLARLIAMRVCGAAILDSDHEGRPYFPGYHDHHIAFSYTYDYVFCACCSKNGTNISGFAIDAINLVEFEDTLNGLPRWFAKFPLTNPAKEKLSNLTDRELVTLWLLQECFSKLYGFHTFYRSFCKILVSEQYQQWPNITWPDFYARFHETDSFLSCIASSSNIFEKDDFSSCLISI